MVKAIELKVGQSETIGEKDRVRMQLAAPAATEGAATSVVFSSADGKPLAELWLGKKYFKSPPDDPAKALGDGRFVMLPSDAARVIIVSEPLKQATAEAKEWIARDGIAIENPKSIEVKGADTNYKLSRAILDTPWQLDGKGGTLDASRAGAAANALARLRSKMSPLRVPTPASTKAMKWQSAPMTASTIASKWAVSKARATSCK